MLGELGGKNMTFTVEHLEKTRESFGEYRYGIYENGTLIAYFWHDYRGDDNGIEFINGSSENAPVGSRGNFLLGGGPQPLTLSKQAINYINENRPKNSA